MAALLAQQHLLQVLLLAGLVLARAAVPVRGPAEAQAAVQALKPQQPVNGMWMVQLRAPPLAFRMAAAAAVGGGGGEARGPAIAAAAPAAAAAARAQAASIAASASVPADKVVASMSIAFSGFAAGPLSDGEVARLRADPRVQRVVPSTSHARATITTPSFLGLDAPGSGPWAQLGGVQNAGEGAVIAVIDSGYWPEAPAFADTINGTIVYGPPPPHFRGTCPPGEAFAGCNRKVVGCRWYTAGLGGDAEVKKQFPSEYLSCRTDDVHGSHVGSIAAGNSANEGCSALLPGAASGTAPRARLAFYKVFWGDSGATDVDIVAAIEQAVADGCDVLNVSFGSIRNLLSVVDVAIQGAALAGVFIAAAAGNGGNLGIVGNYAPWMLTVAASTHSRKLTDALATLGDGTRFSGAGLFINGGTLGPADLVLADAVALPSASAEDAQACLNGTLDAAKAVGKIVVCTAGLSNVAKSAVVKAAGGVGMLLLNTWSDETSIDIFAIPTVHLPGAANDAVRAYASASGKDATATLTSSTIAADEAVAPQMADYSSRGPVVKWSTGQALDLLKPELTAPGSAVLATAPPLSNPAGLGCAYLSGTSMAAPHVAGVAALLRQHHPSWSPMAINSALQTTAYQTTRTPRGAAGQPFGTAWEYGAGHIDPQAALDPGVVFTHGPIDWQRFVCGAELAPEQWGQRCPECVLDADLCMQSRLNTPSVVLMRLAGAATVVRTATSVLAAAADWSASVTPPPGFSVTVAPSRFSLAPGASQQLAITITRTSAAYGGDAGSEGAITLASDAGPLARLPLVARAIMMSAPANVRLPARPANASFNVTPGWRGTVHAYALPPVQARVFEGRVGQIPPFGLPFLPGPGVAEFNITTDGRRAAASVLRFALFDADVAAGTDLDIWVVQGDMLVDWSLKYNSSNEEVTINNASGTYSVYVAGFSIPPGQQDSPFKLHVWTLRSDLSGRALARVVAPQANAPAPSGSGAAVPVTMAFSPQVLKADGSKWLSAVVYSANEATPDGRLVKRGMMAAPVTLVSW